MILTSIKVRKHFRVKGFCLFALFLLIGLVVGNAFISPIFAAENDTQETIQLELEAQNKSKIWTADSALDSQEIYQKAAQLWKSAGNLEKAAYCLREAGKLNLMLNAPEKAYELFQTSLKFERKIKNLKGETESLSYLTIAALKLKKTNESEKYSAQSLALAENVNDYAVKARAFYSAGEVAYEKSEIPKMIAFQEKALAFFREAEDKRGEAEALTNLAYGYVMSNDRLKGRETAQTAIDLQRNLQNKRGLAFALIAFGDANARMGNWEPAFERFKEAESLFPENIDLFERAMLHDRFGTYYETFGDLRQARKHYQKAQTLYTNLGDTSGSSQLLTVLGQISAQLGDHDAAFDYFLQGLKIAEKSKDLVAYGLACRNLGDVYQNKGEFRLASKYYEEALAGLKKVGIKQPIAFVYEKIGKLYERKRDYSAARKNYLLALEINKEIHSKVYQAHNYQELATIDDLESKTESALTNIVESIRLTEDLQGNVLNSQLRQSHFATIFSRYELYIDLLMKMHEQRPNENYAVQALQASEKSRARLMLETIKLSGTDFVKDANPELVKREETLRAAYNSKTNELTEALSSKSGRAEIDQLDDDARDLSAQLEELKGILKQNSPIYSAIKDPESFDVADFQKSVIDANSLLVEFSFGTEKSYAWAISSNEIRSFVLPPREVLETRIQKLRSILADRLMEPNESLENFQTRIKESKDQYWREAQALSNELFGQFGNRLDGKRLMIVPDGKLHYFPVSALPLPDSNVDEPFLLSNEIVYEPSATTLKLIKTMRVSRITPDKNLLVFADPVFSINDDRLSKRAESNAGQDLTSAPNLRFAETLNPLRRLNASQDEAQTISRLSGASKSEILSGFSANRAEIFSPEIYDYKILHFATHGLIDEQRPELSGIILSKFDPQGRTLDNSVRLQDIYGLNLSTDLVVLSACETGIGKEMKGEGLMSFNNAFLQAGAKSVVSSLWKVDDDATGELMKYFYEELATESFTSSESLRRAQMKMWRNSQYNFPFYWAAFTIEGDFQNSPKLAANSFQWIYLALLLPIIAFGFFVSYRIIQRRKRN